MPTSRPCSTTGAPARPWASNTAMASVTDMEGESKKGSRIM